MGNDMFNDEQLAHAEIVQKETEDALGWWKDRALKAEAALSALSRARETDGAVREAAEMREFARDCRDNWDHDMDAHRYNTPCRKCEAAALLSALSSPPRPAALPLEAPECNDGDDCCRYCGRGLQPCGACKPPAPPADAATEAVREAAKIVRDILTAFEARITSQGMLTWSQPDTPTGFVPAILWLERLALAPVPKPAICHGCTGEVEAHPYGQWPCDNHPLRRSTPAPAPSAKEGRS